ncbi:hypothetical protein WJX73_007371 [Symbiochloris irregularis]|uniref:mannosyl-glycoprotein endo-beta-N-acetylglucosaminidase n=1 Tax=Symbiochloris irregularis TaxID=706552 RepID=A0AAW1PEX0_9CHLO
MIGEPEAQALNSLSSLLSWQAGALAPDELFCRGSVPLAQAGKPFPKRPRLLVCHDLAGNYGADRYAQGDDDPCQFRLHHWHSIDIFVYFSHKLVAIPPPGWINCAHRHGTPVLGTFITEWAAGALKCLDLLATHSRAEQYALQLSKLMAHYAFDGWLINIENPVLPLLLPNLQHFLRVLTAACKAANPNSQVIWYDAVTTQGLLKWQDTLNELNAPFFDCCDAIFVNYTWKAGTPQQAAAAAGHRAQDVYMGIDVFGRNTFGGGGFNCDAAASVARQGGVSAALFAPAWVWQNCEAGERQQKWLQREHVLWSTLAASWEQPRVICSQLPFFSNFDCGAGQALYQQGTCISNAPCMQFTGRMLGGVALDMSLFVTRLTIPKAGVLVTYTFLQPGSASETTDFALLLSVEPSAADAGQASSTGTSVAKVLEARQIRLAGSKEADGAVSSSSQKEHHILCLPSDVSRCAGWVTRSFSIDYPALQGFVITGVGAECSFTGSNIGEFQAHLGELVASAAAPDAVQDEEPKPKRRKKKFHRAPTGYNVFIRERLAQVKQNPNLQFADSKEAFKAVVDEWRNLPDEERRHYLQQASSLAIVPVDPALEDPASLAAPLSQPGSPSDDFKELEPAEAELQALQTQQRGRSSSPAQMRSPLQQTPPVIDPRATRSG